MDLIDIIFCVFAVPLYLSIGLQMSHRPFKGQLVDLLLLIVLSIFLLFFNGASLAVVMLVSALIGHIIGDLIRRKV